MNSAVSVYVCALWFNFFPFALLNFRWCERVRALSLLYKHKPYDRGFMHFQMECNWAHSFLTSNLLHFITQKWYPESMTLRDSNDTMYDVWLNKFVVSKYREMW